VGIQFITTSKQYNFASFFSRDKAFEILIQIWKNVKDEKETKKELIVNDEEDDVTAVEEEDDNWEDAFLSVEDSEGGFLNSADPELLQILVEEFPITVLQFFKLFASDGGFVKQYHEQRGDKEIQVKDWSAHAQFGTIRELQYKAPLKQPIGPSSAQCSETQRYHLTKTHLTLESVLVMYGIPYGDYFRIEGRWVVTAGVTPNTCKLSIYGCVYFMKKTWFKSKIETASMKEQEESFQMWVQLGRKEIAKLQPMDKSMDKDPKRASAEQVGGHMTATNTSSDPNVNNSTHTMLSPRRRLSISLKSTIAGISSIDIVAYLGGFFVFFILWLCGRLLPSDTLHMPLLIAVSVLTCRLLSVEKRVSVLEQKQLK